MHSTMNYRVAEQIMISLVEGIQLHVMGYRVSPYRVIGGMKAYLR